MGLLLIRRPSLVARALLSKYPEISPDIAKKNPAIAAKKIRSPEGFTFFNKYSGSISFEARLGSKVWSVQQIPAAERVPS